jgi:hypothetical protein
MRNGSPAFCYSYLVREEASNQLVELWSAKRWFLVWWKQPKSTFCVVFCYCLRITPNEYPASNFYPFFNNKSVHSAVNLTQALHFGYPKPNLNYAESKKAIQQNFILLNYLYIIESSFSIWFFLRIDLSRNWRILHPCFLFESESLEPNPIPYQSVCWTVVQNC